MTTSILVATHKQYEFPQHAGYLPVHVGKANSSHELGIQGDDSGDNISALNPYFCELTGLHWLWKNHRADVYGLAHYRRYFKPIKQGITVAGAQIASPDELASLLDRYPVLLSHPRNYWIESIRGHYAHAHNASDMDALEKMIREKHPGYLDAFNAAMDSNKASLYNMFIMRAEHFQAYCEWLFPILFELEKRIPYREYGSYQKRVFGFLGERLLNVWVRKNFQPSQIKYLPTVNIEGEPKLKKAYNLLRRKFLDEKLT
jgi:hypothetical protein